MSPGLLLTVLNRDLPIGALTSFLSPPLHISIVFGYIMQALCGFGGVRVVLVKMGQRIQQKTKLFLSKPKTLPQLQYFMEAS